MKHFVAEDLVEDRPRRRVVVDDVAVDRETAGGGLLGDVQEGEQRLVALFVDAQIVDAVIAVRHPARRGDRRRRQAARPQQRGAAIAEQIGVVQLVDRVREVEAP